MPKRIHKKPGTKAYEKSVKKTARRTVSNIIKYNKKPGSAGLIINKLKKEYKKNYVGEKTNAILETFKLIKLYSGKPKSYYSNLRKNLTKNYSEIEIKVAQLKLNPNNVSALIELKNLFLRNSSFISKLESELDSPNEKKLYFDELKNNRQIITNLTKKINSLKNDF